MPLSPNPETEHMIEVLLQSIKVGAVDVLGLDEERAKMLADVVATRFFEEFGGSMHYIPKGITFNSSKLHEAIWTDFNGRNHRELQVKYGLSLPFIYSLLKREAARHRAESQPVLPGISTTP